MLAWITAAVSLIAVAPSRETVYPTLPALPPPANDDELPWIEYRQDAPVMDADGFTDWCLTAGLTGTYGRVKLHNLADEYCCTEMRGKVRPPMINHLFPLLKPSGWQNVRLPPKVENGRQHRPVMYRINPYKRVSAK